MGWGGCFCDEHLRVLKSLGCKAKTREELVQNLNAEGLVHPDRKIWLDLNAQTYVDLARKIRKRMDAIDPQIALGLMTSNMISHTIEGRNWSELIEALGGPQRAMVRPHACSYNEVCHTGFFWTFGNLSETLNVLPAGMKTFFEIENAPMSRFAKSNQQTRMQMATVIDGGCNGVTLDVLDFLGTGPASEPAMASMLAATKEKLLTLRTMIAESRQIGIQSILPITTAYTAPGKGKSSIHGLPTVNYGWSIYLGGFGYPCINQPMLQATQPKQIYALAGDPVWAISDAELRNLLQANFVLLDAEAARIIVERNFGELIGIAGIKHHERETSTYSFEESLDGDAKNKMPQRASVNMTEKNAFVQIYDLMTSAQARTVIKDCYNNPLGAGSVTYRNATGGRGLILPYRLPCEFLPHVWARKYWLDRWLEELAGGVTLPFLADAPWVHLSARIGPRQKTLFMANQMFEIYDRLNLYLPDDFASTDWKIEIHSRDKKGRVFVDDGRMTVETELAGNDWLLLVGR